MKKFYLLCAFLFTSLISFAQVPPNDEVQNATYITSLPFVDTNVQTQNATEATTATLTGCMLPDFTRIYYRFEPTEDTPVTISVSNGNSNTFILAYIANSPDVTTDPELYFALNNNDCSFSSNRDIVFEANLVYYILIGNPDNVTDIQFSEVDNANIVNIPDANFKNALLNHTNPVINTNGDSEIQVSEAFFADRINVNSQNISDLTGVEAFVNLEKLYCQSNNISSIDISQNVILNFLECGNNNLTDIDLTNNADLEELYCYYNPLSNLDVFINVNLKVLDAIGNTLNTIDVSQNTYLEEVYFGDDFATGSVDFSTNINLIKLQLRGAHFTNLDVSQNIALEELRIDNCNIESIDLFSNTLLKTFSFQNNLINNLDLSQNINLEDLYGFNNNINVLDLNNNVNLNKLYISNNNLQALDLSQNINIESLSCSNNQISNLDVTSLSFLYSFSASYNPITNINLTQNPELRILGLSGTLITSIDISNNTNISNISLRNNQFLENINFKNSNNSLYDQDNFSYTFVNGDGSIGYSSYFNTTNNPNLQTICLDDVAYATTKFTEVDPNTVFVEDCSISTISYNSIQGTVAFDANNNGCDTNDFIVANQLIQANDGANNIATFTNSTGDYSLYLNENTYNTEVLGLASNFSVTPNPYSTTFTGFGNSENADFCITSSLTINDVNIVLLPITQARPGFDAEYQLVFENTGTTLLSGAVTLSFDDASQTFVSASPTESASSTNSLTFNYTNLQPFEIRTIDLVMNTFPPTTVNDGDILNFTATINPISGDNNTDDNTFNLAQTVVNSYDPNDKQVLQGNEITLPQASAYLDYIIRFQNTGSASAINVVITDQLSSKLDWTTLRPVSASHDYSVRILNEDFVEVSFENINLPAQQNDEEGSNGFVAFKIKPKTDVEVGDFIFGTANIYFDFNAPIVTNTVSTEIVEPLSTNESGIESFIKTYPNPVSNTLHIESKNTLESISIYDVNGRQLKHIAIVGNKRNTEINTSTLSNGIYFVKIKTQIGMQTTKIIKN